MVVYQVSITLQAGRESEWIDWMRQVHLRDVLNTGCFTRCSVAKVVEPPGDEVTYVIRYDCSSFEVYERYRTGFAPALQQEHTTRFAGAFRGSRLVLQEVLSLERGPDIAGRGAGTVCVE